MIEDAGSMVKNDSTRTQMEVEPLFTALEDGSDEELPEHPAARRSHLGWKLLSVALVLLALLAIVLNQAF